MYVFISNAAETCECTHTQEVLNYLRGYVCRRKERVPAVHKDSPLTQKRGGEVRSIKEERLEL